MPDAFPMRSAREPVPADGEQDRRDCVVAWATGPPPLGWTSPSGVARADTTCCLPRATSLVLPTNRSQQTAPLVVPVSIGTTVGLSLDHVTRPYALWRVPVVGITTDRGTEALCLEAWRSNERTQRVNVVAPDTTHASLRETRSPNSSWAAIWLDDAPIERYAALSVTHTTFAPALKTGPGPWNRAPISRPAVTSPAMGTSFTYLGSEHNSRL